MIKINIDNKLAEVNRKLSLEYIVLIIIFLSYHFLANLYLKDYKNAVFLLVVIFFYYVNKVHIHYEDNNRILMNYVVLLSVLFYHTSFFNCPYYLLYYIPLVLSIPFFYDLTEDRKYISAIVIIIFVSCVINFTTDFELFKKYEYNSERVQLVKKFIIIDVSFFTCAAAYFVFRKSVLLKAIYIESNERKKINTEQKTEIESTQFETPKSFVSIPEKNKTNTFESVIDPYSETIRLINENKDGFLAKFKIHFLPFYTTLISKFPNLVLSEIEVCALLKLKLSTKEIACITNSTPRAIESKKYRIRKKVGISGEADLYKWIETI